MKLTRKLITYSIMFLLTTFSTVRAENATGIPIFRVGGGVSTTMVIDDKIQVVAYPYMDQILEGLIPSHTNLEIHGHNHNVGTVNEEISDLETVGYGNWPSAEAAVVLVSTDVDDDGDPVDTGARTVIVRGLTDNAGSWEEAEEAVTMDGTTPTAGTTILFIRLHELEVVTCGTSLSNEGDITASISGTDIIRMYADHGKTSSGRWTVPSDMVAYINALSCSTINTKDSTFHVFTRDASTSNTAFLVQRSVSTLNAGFATMARSSMRLTEKTDIIFIGHCEQAGGKLNMYMDGWYEEP